MAVFEKPLAELRRYEGRNPRPGDFDAFWDESLAEMRAVDARVELRPSEVLRSRVAECFDLYFTGVRGARVHAKYLRPRGAGKGLPAVVHFHGYSGNSGDWQDRLGQVAEGMCVAFLDCRGQGGLSEDTGGQSGTTFKGQFIRGLDGAPRDLLMRHIFLDAAQLAGIVMGMPEVDGGRVGCTGWSQGGALAYACAALEPRIRRAAPVYPFLADYQRVWEMDLAAGAYDELKAYFRQFDPLHEREAEIFTKLGYLDIQHLAPRIQGEVLMGTGLMDMVCPPSTQFAAFNKVRGTKDVVIYPDFGHEGLPGMMDRIHGFMLGL